RNRAAAERLINALSQRMFLLPDGAGGVEGMIPAGAGATNCLSADGKLRATREGVTGESFRVVDATSGAAKATVSNAHAAPIRHFAFSPDGQRLITASSDSTAKVWRSETGELLQTLSHHSPLCWAEFSADGSNIVT